MHRELWMATGLLAVQACRLGQVPNADSYSTIFQYESLRITLPFLNV